MTAPTDAMRQAVDTLEQNARRVISDCVHLRRMWDEHPDGPVCDDPLGQYRNPDGSVCCTTGYADEVRVGDWVQACHGDLGWSQVVDTGTTSDGQVSLTTIGGDEDDDGRLRWWDRGGAIRVAVFPTRSDRPTIGDLQRRAVLGDADAVDCLEAWGGW